MDPLLSLALVRVGGRYRCGHARQYPWTTRPKPLLAAVDVAALVRDAISTAATTTVSVERVKAGCQRAQAPPDPTLHRTFGLSERNRHLPIRPAFEVGERDDLALRGCEAP